MLWLASLGLLWESQEWEQGLSLTLLPVLATLFLLLGCLVQPRRKHWITLLIVVSHHVDAGNRTRDL